MIESPIPNYIRTQSALREAVISKRFQFYSNNDVVVNIVGNNNFEYVGRGTECIVIAPLREKHRLEFGEDLKSDTVIALDFDKTKSPTEAKEIFYAQRIMSTLFPHNFPRFRIIYGAHLANDHASGSLRERLTAAPNGEDRTFGYKTLDVASQFPFKTVIQTNVAFGMPFDFDYAGCNFMRCADGGVYYVDKIFTQDPDRLHRKKIEQYMMENGYGGLEIHIVLKSLDRLIQLRRSLNSDSTLPKNPNSLLPGLSR